MEAFVVVQATFRDVANIVIVIIIIVIFVVCRKAQVDNIGDNTSHRIVQQPQRQQPHQLTKTFTTDIYTRS